MRTSTTLLLEIQGPSLVRMAASMTWMKNSSCMDLLKAAKLWRPLWGNPATEVADGNCLGPSVEPVWGAIDGRTTRHPGYAISQRIVRKGSLKK